MSEVSTDVSGFLRKFRPLADAITNGFQDILYLFSVHLCNYLVATPP